MKAAIYCRVSTDNQEAEGTSLQTQLEACLLFSYETRRATNEQDKFRWAEPKPTDTIIEVRFGVPLGSIEPQKVNDCVLLTSPPLSPSG